MRKIVIELIIRIFKKVFASAPTHMEGHGPGELEKRLQGRIKKDGW